MPALFRPHSHMADLYIVVFTWSMFLHGHERSQALDRVDHLKTGGRVDLKKDFIKKD